MVLTAHSVLFELGGALSTQSSVGSRARALTLLFFYFSLFQSLPAKKRIHYNEGGQAGNREEKINNLIQRMN